MFIDELKEKIAELEATMHIIKNADAITFSKGRTLAKLGITPGTSLHTKVIHEAWLNMAEQKEQYQKALQTMLMHATPNKSTDENIAQQHKGKG